VIQSLVANQRLPALPAIWRRTLVASGVFLVATLLWAQLTGHSLGAGPSSSLVSPFNSSWFGSVAITFLGAGAFLAIALAWPLARTIAPLEAGIYLGTLALLVVGAIGWGARLGDFTMFYLFFAGIAIIATPVAAVAIRRLWEHLRATNHLRLAVGLAVLCLIQLELGVVYGVLRLQAFGPQVESVPMPLGLLESIRALPPGARLAYSCEPFEESGFGVPRMISVDAHTGRRVVPMCYEAEVFSELIGAERSLQVQNSAFQWAPQRVVYPDAAATPSSAEVAAFLKGHGIDYIYADALHPNTLVDDAVPIATSEGVVVLKLR
jgi:hypothetical protein